MEKRILIIEDQKDSIESAFDFANEIGFNGELKFDYKPRSQDINYERLSDFDLLFVDITLANKSQMNGFGIIKHIIDNTDYPLDRIVILTGNSLIKEGLKQNDIPENIEIVYKPVTFKQLIPVFQKFLIQDR